MEDISSLRLFVQVCDLGSFSAVARSTHTTPSAVSRQISRLEENLGARLLQRTTRQQVLTEAGEVYLRHARQIVEDVDMARRAVSELSNAPSGVLRVTMEADLAQTLLSPILPEFLAAYPDLRVQLHTSAALEDLVGRGIDVAVRVGHLENSSLIAKRLSTSRSLLVACPGYLEQNGTPQYPEDLVQLSCLSFRVEADQTIWHFKSGDSVSSVPILGRVQVSSLIFLREAAKSGLGIAMLPTWVARNDLNSGRLVPVLPGYPLEPPATPVSAVYPTGRNLASKVRVFINFLANKMRSDIE